MMNLDKREVEAAYQNASWYEQRVPRARATRKNPFGVAIGQVWQMTDWRPDRMAYDIVVTKVYPRGGYAEVVTPHISRVRDGQYVTRRIRLDRFSPRHHYRLVS